MKSSGWLIVFVAGTLLFAGNGRSEGENWHIAGTKHNLSITGPGPIKSDDPDSEICIFCHTPHQGRVDVTYLWNRADSTAEYITYESSTLHTGDPDGTRRRVGQPTGASKLCLSCHDGTIALGAVLSREQEISFPVGLEFLTNGRLSSGPGYLGTDLSDDHPISFVYDDALAISNGQLVSPAFLSSDIRLDGGGMLQCTSCHDPHDNTYGKFLVMENRNGALCTSCHVPTGWDNSSHKNSTATWNQQGDDPWPNTEFNTVAENACANCHRSHKAGGHERLLDYANETANCVICHNGSVAQKNIVYEQGKQYGHFVQNYTGTHDPAVDFSGIVTPYVACVSCHNPHRTNNGTATAPYVSGALRGVKGIDVDGNPVDSAQYQYEVCLKCHSGNNIFLPETYTPIARQDPSQDLRLAFDTINASYHPVFGPGKNGVGFVPSLLVPYTNTSVIYCTDCHNNDDSSGPKGPHGSDNRYLLELNYTTADYTEESSFDYAMCYKCHDRNKVLNDASRFPHRLHLGATVKAPCSACHDPHGSRFNSHLINFDTGIVKPNSRGLLGFNDYGLFTGSCNLVCHGLDHSDTLRY